MPIVIAFVLALFACGGRPPAVVGNRSTSAVRHVVVHHALMTYVMDSPEGQRDKARDAVEASKLVAAIRERGHAIEIRFDAAAGDDVVVEVEGRELGRASLHDIAGGAAPAQILDRL